VLGAVTLTVKFTRSRDVIKIKFHSLASSLGECQTQDVAFCVGTGLHDDQVVAGVVGVELVTVGV